MEVKSLHKALKILECFNSTNSELGITQISSIMGLNKSNVHNIVTTFEKCGYLEKNSDNSKYSLGLKMLEFSYTINKKLEYQRAVYDVMYQMSNKLNIVCYFAIPSNGKVLYLYNTFPLTKQGDYPYRTILGERADFYCTAIGKAMLSRMEEDEVENYIKSPKIKHTENTIINPNQLRKEIKKTRSLGYSIDNMEHEHNVKCMGVAIVDRDGILVGALSISATGATFDRHVDEYEMILKESAFQIKDRL